MEFCQNFQKSNLSDEELVIAIKSGSVDLLHILINRYLGLIYNKANSFVSIAEREDIIQEGIIALYSAVNVYDSNISAFYTFANLCIERSMLSYCRKLSCKKQIPNYSLVSLDEGNNNTTTSTPESLIIEKEECLTFTNKIKKTLSSFELKVLSEFLLGNSYEKISQNLNVNVKSVNNAMVRLRNKIRAI